MRLHPVGLLSLACSLVICPVQAQQPVPSSPVTPSPLTIPPDEETQTVQLVDGTGKLVALVDSKGVATVVPGELLSHAKNVLVTLRVGSATAMYTYPYTAPATPAK